MNNLAARIGRIAEELLELQNELEAGLHTGAPETLALASERGQSLQSLKEAVDNARHVVWVLVLASEQGACENAGYALNEYRMHRIRQMVAALALSADDRSRDLFLAELRRLGAGQA